MSSDEFKAYWQAYGDLIERWAKSGLDDFELGMHYLDHGQPEGRKIPSEADVPANWSDWLFFSNQQDSINWWWRKGTIDTGVYSAMAKGEDALHKGVVENSQGLQDSSSLSAFALAQVAKNATQFPGQGPLPEILDHKLQWAEPKATGLLAITDIISEHYSENYDYIIVLPWLESGGAELVGMWHYKALKQLGHNPLVILADNPNITNRFAAENFDILNLPDLYEETMGRPYTKLSRDDRVEILTAAIETIQPNFMHLIHSFIGYSALNHPNTKKRIRKACNTIFVSAFCPHIHPAGNYDGYFREIPNIIDVVDLFVFDNDWYLGEMAKAYMLPAAQSTALKYPIEKMRPRSKSKAPKQKVLWASRFDSQKNPGIVAEIAAKLPEVEFLMYGRQVLGDDQINWENMPENVSLMGEFFNIEELPTKECFAFLYTSKFDGTPNILLEIGSLGLPIVTPNIGGIAGFLGADWPLYVTDPDDVDSYVAQINKLLDNAKLGNSLTLKQDEILKAERSFKAFLSEMNDLISPFKSA